MENRPGRVDAVPRRRWAVAGLLFAVVYLLGSVLLGLLHDSAAPDLPMGLTWFIRGVALLVAVVGAVAILGTLTVTSAEVSDTGILVRTFAGSRHHAWADVQRVRRNAGGDGADAIEIQFTTGRGTLDLDVFAERVLLETLRRVLSPELFAAAQGSAAQ